MDSLDFSEGPKDSSPTTPVAWWHWRESFPKGMPLAWIGMEKADFFQRNPSDKSLSQDSKLSVDTLQRTFYYFLEQAPTIKIRFLPLK